MKINCAEVVDYQVLNTTKGGVHWFWWLFWLFVFFPVLLLVAIVHVSCKETSTVIVKTSRGVVKTYEKVDAQELQRVQIACAFK